MQLGKNVIQIENLVDYKDITPTEIFKSLINNIPLPKKFHYPLWSRICLIKRFNNDQERKQLIQIRLLALSIFVQAHPNTVFLSSLFETSPQLIPEIVELAFSDAEEDMRILSLQLLISLTFSDAEKRSALTAALGCKSHNGALPSAIRSGLLSITQNTSQMSSKFLDQLFWLVLAVISVERGIQALKNSGIFSSFIPILSSNVSPDFFINVLTLIISFIETDETLVDLLKELSGFEILLKRLSQEVTLAIENKTATEEDCKPFFKKVHEV